MAQKIQTLFIDDIDGGAAEGTVRFALDGTEYEIDLNAKHSDHIRWERVQPRREQGKEHIPPNTIKSPCEN